MESMQLSESGVEVVSTTQRTIQPTWTNCIEVQSRSRIGRDKKIGVCTIIKFQVLSIDLKLPRNRLNAPSWDCHLFYERLPKLKSLACADFVSELLKPGMVSLAIDIPWTPALFKANEPPLFSNPKPFANLVYDLKFDLFIALITKVTGVRIL